ncbi:hypothetical protein SLS56_003244 [Neofusicoccum ribis]|uniref:Uncharacterized protein n=1 Tax=Neofusicoccum ribis TaxID=45134 RepID=A0ABR3T0T1_9PEZI
MESSKSLPQYERASGLPNEQEVKERSQYQHYVPRFILRNFAHHSEPVIGDSKRSGKHRNKRKRPNSKKPDMLHLIKLGDPVERVEVSLATEFGKQDMYRDFQRAVDQQHIEKKLAYLECRVAPTIEKFRIAQENGKDSVEIMRSELDELRKFLFIMKYRGSTQRKRFYDRDIDTYSANDRQYMVEYMRRRRFQTPIQVWYDNIKTIVDLNTNTKNWDKQLHDSIYPLDAEWGIANLRQYYLEFCTPTNDDEFILTENGYSIHEGPVCCMIDPRTGHSTTTAYTEYHKFAVVSPKLIMILRSTLLPCAEEDSDPHIKKQREQMLQATRVQHTNPDTANSSLEDLPVTKARTSYAKLKINAVMLNEAHSISTIAYGSPEGASKALDYYLTSHNDDDSQPLKIVYFPEDPTLRHLRRMERAARLFGSEAVAAFHTDVEEYDRQMLIGLLRNLELFAAQEP